MYKYNQKNERRCLICNELTSNNITIEQFLFPNNLICGTCMIAMCSVNKIYDIYGMKVHALYLYTALMETTLFQYKECYDTALAELFLKPYIKEIIDKYCKYTIVFMPSSFDKIKERGFFPLEKLFTNIKLNKIELFIKNKNYKQSLQNEKNRQNIKHIITLKEHIILPETPLLIVDDVLTSGNSLLWAKQLLCHHKYEVKVLCIAIHPGVVEKCERI